MRKTGLRLRDRHRTHYAHEAENRHRRGPLCRRNRPERLPQGRRPHRLGPRPGSHHRGRRFRDVRSLQHRITQRIGACLRHPFIRWEDVVAVARRTTGNVRRRFPRQPQRSRWMLLSDFKPVASHALFFPRHKPEAVRCGSHNTAGGRFVERPSLDFGPSIGLSSAFLWWRRLHGGQSARLLRDLASRRGRSHIVASDWANSGRHWPIY